METILRDIELDVAELKCLLHALAADGNPALRGAARRGICQMQARLDELLARLDEVGEPCATAPEPSFPVEEMAEELVPAVSVVPPPSPAEPEPAPEEKAAAPEEPKPAPVLGERIRAAVDLRHAMSLNDRFLFVRELFGGDAGRMDSLLERLARTDALDEAVALFLGEVRPADDSEAASRFMELLETYYRN